MRARAFLFSWLPLALAIQPSAPPAKPAALRPLKWGKLNFLATTDTHGWHAGHLQEPQYSADWGDYYSFTVRMRELANKEGVDLLIVDTGDRIEGSGLSDATEPKGKYVREIFSTVDMDVVTIGNHELYKAESVDNEYLVMRPHYGERYVVSNVDIYAPDTGKLVPLGNRYRKFTTKNQGIKVMAFAFLFDFTGNFKNSVVYPVEVMIKEPWFLEAISDTDVDLFLIIGHTPVKFSPEFPAILATIRAFRPDVPVQFFGGHTHIRDFAYYDTLSTALESGRYCETVGWLSISHIPSRNSSGTEEPKVEFNRSYIDFNRFGFQQHSRQTGGKFDTKEGLELSKKITRYRRSLGLDKFIGCIPQDYYMYRVPYPHQKSLYSLLGERILPDMVNRPERKGVPTFIYINTGSQRFDLFKGQFTPDTAYSISPFTSTFRYLPNIPYSVARQLITFLNRPRNPWILTSTGTLEQPRPYSLPPLSPLEPYYQHQKLLSEQQPIPHHDGKQIPLASRPPPHTHHTSPAVKPPTFHEMHLRPAPLTPGYTTDDDFGHDGDDTPHESFTYNDLPNAIAGNRSFEGVGEPVVVDVVFMDFIEPYVLAGLEHLGQKFGSADSRSYVEGTLTEMIVEWVERQWGGSGAGERGC